MKSVRCCCVLAVIALLLVAAAVDGKPLGNEIADASRNMVHGPLTSQRRSRQDRSLQGSRERVMKSLEDLLLFKLLSREKSLDDPDADSNMIRIRKRPHCHDVTNVCCQFAINC